MRQLDRRFWAGGGCARHGDRSGIFGVSIGELRLEVMRLGNRAAGPDCRKKIRAPRRKHVGFMAEKYLEDLRNSVRFSRYLYWAPEWSLVSPMVSSGIQARLCQGKPERR